MRNTKLIRSGGGGNITGGCSPFDTSLIPELGANRFAFINQNGVSIEYSNDGGTTWKDYGNTYENNVALFSIRDKASFHCGKKATDAGENDMLRVTIDSIDGGVYSWINKFYIFYHANEQNNTYCKVQRALAQEPDNFIDISPEVTVSIYDNIINVEGFQTYGGTEGFKSFQNQKIRFIFGGGKTKEGYESGVLKSIFAYGKFGWSANSTLARTGRLYSYDEYQNAYFPNGISAGTFNGYTIKSNVPSDAKFTDTTYGSINANDVEKLFE